MKRKNTSKKEPDFFMNRMKKKGFRKEYYKEDLIESFLDEVDSWMTVREMSKKKLAKKCKITELHLTNLLNRHSIISAEEMSNIAFVLGCRLNVEWHKDTGTL